jgi:tetratricopeptide (TPR) repeat protein
MPHTPSTNSSIRRFFAELSNRRVFQVAGTYIAGAWAMTEILSFLFEQFPVPGWAYKLLAIILVVGFPISMVLAWVIQVSEEGHWEMDPSHGDSRTLAAAIATGVLLTAGLSWLILPQSKPPPVFEPMPGSLAVWHLADPELSLDDQASANRIYQALMIGLQRSPELTLVRLEPGKRPDNPQAIGKTIGVESLVYGLLTGDGSAEFNMVDVLTGEIAWSTAYSWGALQDQAGILTVANEILQSKSQPTLNAREFMGTGDAEAYDAFLDGNIQANMLKPGQFSEALESFQAAINIDPAYVSAYTGLAQAAYDLIGENSLSNGERQVLEQRAHRAVDMARKLDRNSADAMSLYALELDSSQLRIQAWERALELDSDHFKTYYRYAMQSKEVGKLNVAERLLKHAIKLCPMNTGFRRELASILKMQGRDLEAQNVLDKLAALQLPENI